MTRKTALELMRIAGYHADSRTFARLLVGARVSRPAALAAFCAGSRARLAGMGCSCAECRETPSDESSASPR